MVQQVRGNLLDAEVQALVNTVNTVGIMGKGIALQFKKAFPENYKAYKRACDAGQVQPGRMFVFDRGALYSHHRYIINFPTKRHWRSMSKIEDIESGLAALVDDTRRLGLVSLAVPPLGCGNGGLEWSVVSQLIECAFANVPDVDVLVFEPAGSPPADEMKNRTHRPRMTMGRAAVLGLMGRYLLPRYDPLSLLELVKLAYFLQEAGEPLKLRFQKDRYGPYADELRHVVERLEGHYIQGFGDGKIAPTTEIHLLPQASEEAEEFLTSYPETHQRFDRVAKLIEGFETPYGMELLASVHWVATHKKYPLLPDDVEAVIAGVRAWSKRKAKLFEPEHIQAAWEHLREHRWL
jgi:O-acetyl-ADP-ribose deacetylase (regulator of RNase III)